MHVLEATGTLDRAEFYRLPVVEQELWLAHAAAKITGRYLPDPKDTGQDDTAVAQAAILANMGRA